jgi:hypothetical protein
VQSVQDKFMQFGIGADQFEKYLKLKTNDIRYNEAHTISSSNAAEQFAQNLINNVPKTGTGGTGSNGTGNTGNGANKITGTAKNEVKEELVEEKTAEKIRAEWDKNRKLPTIAELENDQIKKEITSLEARQKRMERVLKRTNLTKSERADAQEDLDSIKKELKTLRDMLKG